MRTRLCVWERGDMSEDSVTLVRVIASQQECCALTITPPQPLQLCFFGRGGFAWNGRSSFLTRTYIVLCLVLFPPPARPARFANPLGCSSPSRWPCTHDISFYQNLASTLVQPRPAPCTCPGGPCAATAPTGRRAPMDPPVAHRWVRRLTNRGFLQYTNLTRSFCKCSSGSI